MTWPGKRSPGEGRDQTKVGHSQGGRLYHKASEAVLPNGQHQSLHKKGRGLGGGLATPSQIFKKIFVLWWRQHGRALLHAPDTAEKIDWINNKAKEQMLTHKFCTSILHLSLSEAQHTKWTERGEKKEKCLELSCYCSGFILGSYVLCAHSHYTYHIQQPFDECSNIWSPFLIDMV